MNSNLIGHSPLFRTLLLTGSSRDFLNIAASLDRG
jgi:hypothetical protein